MHLNIQEQTHKRKIFWRILRGRMFSITNVFRETMFDEKFNFYIIKVIHILLYISLADIAGPIDV